MAELSPLGAEIIHLVSVHKAMVANQLEEINLYPGQEMALLALSEGQPCSQNELAHYLYVDHSTVATSVSRMEKAGWIERQKSDKDRRVTILKLTSQGNEIVGEIRTIMTDSENQMTSNLSNEERQAFVNVAHKIIVNLKE